MNLISDYSIYHKKHCILNKLKGKILLTGYEPFLEFKRNPSLEACRLLEGNTYHNYKIIVEELPMRYKEIRSLIQDLVDNHSPSAVISTGVSNMGQISVLSVLLLT
jgi:pyrrolidone-carboxylate peptidase